MQVERGKESRVLSISKSLILMMLLCWKKKTQDNVCDVSSNKRQCWETVLRITGSWSLKGLYIPFNFKSLLHTRKLRTYKDSGCQNQV
jgi:hypothetical protein